MPESVDRPTLLFISVEGKTIGEMDMELDSGKAITDAVVLLDVLCLVGETGAKMPITLAVPQSCGHDLIRHLLTEEQFEAAMYAGD